MLTSSTSKTLMETVLLGMVKLGVLVFGLWAAAQAWDYTASVFSTVDHSLEAANDRG